MNCITKKLSCVLFSFVLLGCTTPSNKTSTITSEESPTVKMRVQDGYIQYYNGTDWENLISTEELKGEKGDKGDSGKDGKDGRDGKNGTNGTNGINGVNGKNGSDGNDAENGITKGFLLYTEANGNIPFQNNPWGGGYIEIESLDKSVISSKTVEDNSKITSVNLLMNENGKVKLTAKSSAGWNFVKWSDGSTNPSRTISYDSSVILSAYFDCTKKPLTTPVILTEDIDCDKQSLYLVWKTDENAKDYTITVSKGYYDGDIIYSGKSTTNNITINSDKLKNENTYYIRITANPKNPDNYYAQSVYDICSTMIVPTIEPIVTPTPTPEPIPTIEPTPTPEPTEGAFVTPLTTPTITSNNVNIESGDLTITWAKDAHAVNYSITVGDMKFTSDSGTLVIKADQLSNNTEYRIVITANPADANNYSATTYEENYKYEFTKASTPDPTNNSTEG